MLPSANKPSTVAPCIELELSEGQVRHLREQYDKLSRSLFPPAKCHFKSASVVQICHSELSIRKLIACRMVKYLSEAMSDYPTPRDTPEVTQNNVQHRLSQINIESSRQTISAISTFEHDCLSSLKVPMSTVTAGPRPQLSDVTTAIASESVALAPKETLRFSTTPDPHQMEKRKQSRRGRIASSSRVSTFQRQSSTREEKCAPEPTSTLSYPESPSAQKLPDFKALPKRSEEMPVAFGQLRIAEPVLNRCELQTPEPPIGSVVVRGAPAVSLTKAQMTGKFLYSCAALSDIREGSELQHRVWGALLNQHSRRVLIIGPPASGKRKAFMSVAAQIQRSGTVVIVTYGKRRIEKMLNTIGFVPSVNIKPYWRGSDANILVVCPGWLRSSSRKLPKVSMLVVDMFDQLLDWGIERLIIQAAAKLSPDAYIVATARTPSQRLFKFAEHLQLTTQIEVVSKIVPEALMAGRSYNHEVIEFKGNRRQAVQNVISPIDHGTNLIILFVKSAKEGNQLSESLEDQGICDTWSFHSSFEEVRMMSKDHLAERQCALYIAISSDHECLVTAKGFVDVVINMRPAECDQMIAFRSSLLKPGGRMITLKRVAEVHSKENRKKNDPDGDDENSSSAVSEEMLLKSLALLLEFGPPI